MKTVGLRELRQNASEIVREVEAGGEVTITVAGRDSAKIVPISRGEWRRWSDIAALFAGPEDPDWEADHVGLDEGVRDPWPD